jgi:hypothetical protein
VKDLELTRGDSRIRVDGAIAPNTRESSSIDVTAERVQLADLNSVLLGTRKVTGQLDGSARIEGTMSNLRVNGTAAVTQGSVDGVAFDRLDAKAGYTAGAVTLDARLQAGDSGELSARGSMPTSFGASAPADAQPFDSHGPEQPAQPRLAACAFRRTSKRFPAPAPSTFESPCGQEHPASR